MAITAQLVKEEHATENDLFSESMRELEIQHQNVVLLLREYIRRREEILVRS